MGYITRISKQKQGEYAIYVDDEPLFSVDQDVLIQCALYKGMYLNAKATQKCIQMAEVHAIRKAVLRYLKAPRTVCEVKRYLKGIEGKSTYKEQVISEMIDCGYLDDQQYANRWVEQKRRNKKWGPIRLRHELEKKGIAACWIEKAVPDTEENRTEEKELAMSLAKRLYDRMSHQPWQTVKRKMGNHLVRQGYTMGVVLSVLDEIGAQYAKQRGEECDYYS